VDTVLLRTFLEVSKTRHFGRAAENLFITHSAVSFRIRQLEQLLGGKLFDRQRNNLRLTQAGERLIPYAETILASWQMALQDVGVSQGQFIQLCLGGTPNIWDAYLQQKLPEIAIQFPALSQRSEVSSQVELVRSILEGKTDLGLVFDPPKIAEINVCKISEFKLVLVSHLPDVSLGQLQEIGYVFVDWGTAFNVQHARLFEQSIAPVLHTGQSNIAFQYLLARGGAAFLPSSLITTELQQGKLHRVIDCPSINRDIYAIYLMQSEKLEAIESVIDFISGPAE
jgi:DNA-binding transcriptional LysR family regulator